MRRDTGRMRNLVRGHMLLRRGPKGARERSLEHDDEDRVEEIRHRLSSDEDASLYDDTHHDLDIEVHQEPDVGDETRIDAGGPASADDIDDNVVLTTPRVPASLPSRRR